MQRVKALFTSEAGNLFDLQSNTLEYFTYTTIMVEGNRAKRGGNPGKARRKPTIIRRVLVDLTYGRKVCSMSWTWTHCNRIGGRIPGSPLVNICSMWKENSKSDKSERLDEMLCTQKLLRINIIPRWISFSGCFSTVSITWRCILSTKRTASTSGLIFALLYLWQTSHRSI